jgi:hypothetical protein
MKVDFGSIDDDVKELDAEAREELKEIMDDGPCVPANYPYALRKACEDTFCYALGLSTGTVVFFGSAHPLSAEWVCLNEVEEVIPPVYQRMYFSSGDHRDHTATFDRGMEIQVSMIVWVADAPFGS